MNSGSFYDYHDEGAVIEAYVVARRAWSAIQEFLSETMGVAAGR